jgi:hypothetical protein
MKGDALWVSGWERRRRHEGDDFSVAKGEYKPSGPPQLAIES